MTKSILLGTIETGSLSAMAMRKYRVAVGAGILVVMTLLWGCSSCPPDCESYRELLTRQEVRDGLERTLRNVEASIGAIDLENSLEEMIKNIGFTTFSFRYVESIDLSFLPGGKGMEVDYYINKTEVEGIYRVEGIFIGCSSRSGIVVSVDEDVTSLAGAMVDFKTGRFGVVCE